MRASIATSDLCHFALLCWNSDVKVDCLARRRGRWNERASLSVSHTHSGCALCANVLWSQPIKISFWQVMLAHWSLCTGPVINGRFDNQGVRGSGLPRCTPAPRLWPWADRISSAGKQMNGWMLCLFACVIWGMGLSILNLYSTWKKETKAHFTNVPGEDRTRSQRNPKSWTR